MPSSTKTSLENDVPMQGAGFYNANSDLQAAAMRHVLPLFDTIAKDSTCNPFTVVEYGCAQGANSILPIKRILAARFPPQKRISHPAPETINGNGESKTSENTSQEILLTFSDRAGNDFNTLVETISNAEWFSNSDTESSERTAQSILASMAAGTFYSRLVPRDSVDVGFSLATLHHLERWPANASPAAEADVLHEQTKPQAHADLVHFLTLRGQEFRHGGSLILSFVSQASTGVPNYPSLVDSCRQAMISMIVQGRIDPAVAGSFHVPTHDRTIEEVKDSLASVVGLWDVEELFEKEVTHPAYAKFQEPSSDQANSANGEASISEWYAETVVDWMMAVITGYFIKALRTGAPGLGPEQQQELVDEWRDRTKEVFLKEYKDERVACWFVYVKLRRM
ncbi:S-adenosyl-L-methionine-dependent methyltransferase [Aspergillus stella-maris]|uniref:S-adenosyl-L-methionine-dependent methyltransferase n=1 Tax=Aspergillus stella-maris TaxID=1810926 RepID=UPI003CCDB4DC